jgi:hypothetical protein
MLEFVNSSKPTPPGPGPKPPTPHSNQTEEYTVAGMNVEAIYFNKDKSYNKVIVQLHGGGGDNQMWNWDWQQGMYGNNVTDVKLVNPTSYRSGHTWYQDFKRPNCGLNDDCAYNLTTIKESGERIQQLIEHEMKHGNLTAK